MARGETDYESMTVDELREEAKKQGLGGTSHMRKEELIETIKGESDGGGATGARNRGGETRGRGDNEPSGDSKSVKYSQHITSPDQHEEREGRSLITRDHDVIRQWAQERKATPATIRGTRVLRFNFPGFDESDRIEEISWDEFFRRFDERNLNFIYQEHRSDGRQSNFFRFESPDREDA
jgi:hypothetical protein